MKLYQLIRHLQQFNQQSKVVFVGDKNFVATDEAQFVDFRPQVRGGENVEVELQISTARPRVSVESIND